MTQPSTRTEQTPAVRVLEAAARQSLHAPSAFNTQPWRWRVTPAALELRADRSRQLATTDPDGRLLTLSCGAVLHHARVSLTAAGWAGTVERFPDPDDPALLARLRTTGPADLDVAAEALSALLLTATAGGLATAPISDARGEGPSRPPVGASPRRGRPSRAARPRRAAASAPP